MNFISKKYQKWKLNKDQKKINKKFKENGLTDEILKKQIKINKKRNELNLVDKTTLNDEGFSQ